MDIVDTFNHLIPSDQLDDSLLIGQNLECDASNEFGTLVQLEDSLRNMLSDKDPMLGSASCSQFDLLDNEDSSFQIAGPTGLEVSATDAGLGGAPSGELKSTETAVVKRPVGRPRKKPRHPVESEPTDGEVSAKRTPTGRPGRKPVNRLQKSFLIEKGVTGDDLKKELTLGGRINISDLDVGLWINPVVVLKRLTVTVGGFRIELLPGPSYAANAADAGQSVCFEDSFSYCGDIQYAMLQDDAQEDAAQENETNLGGVENISTEEDVPLGLGPYVNPNEVQAANGALMRSPCTEETEPDNQSGPTKHKPVGAEKDGVKQPQNTHGIKTDSNSKDKEKTLGQKQLKSKQALTPLKSKNSSTCRPSSTMKGPKSPQNKPSKITHAPAVNRGKTLNEKDVSLKRHGEELQNDHAPKVQKMQDKHANKVKPKLPGASSGAGGKKSPSSSDSGPAEPQGPTKNSHVVGPKPESSQPAHGATGHSSKTTEDGGQEKSKVKKPEKILQRQKSKTVRSLSVDEPQLFIPDNAPPPPPVVIKETVEDQTTAAASSDTAWEGNNCGLCKKHHNNTFMVGCGRCDDWFHGDCVGLDLTKVREMEEEDQMYVCLKCCAEEPDTPSTAKPEGQAKPDAPQDHKAAPPPKPRQGQLPTSPGARPVKKESERKQSTEVKDTSQKTVPPKLEMKKKTSSPGVKKPASVDEIRRSVRDSLKEILLQRLKDSDLKITSEKASEVAKKTERELFHLYRDTDSKYKNKYRSLMFNLKDTKNNVLFKRVLKAEISPAQLIRMSPEELASKELAAWRKRENRHTIEMIEKQEREVERRPITKITHKGEIEIESQEPAKTSETVEPEPAPKVTEALLDHLLPLEKVESAKTVKDTTAQHKSHLFDLHCKICTGRMAPPVEEAQTKVVATTVVRRQSAPSEELKVTTPPVKDEDLHLTVLEESFLKAKSFVSEGRSEFSSGRVEEAAFLSTLNKLWRGFINMPAVAKLVTKVFPVSGILDNLTEDLPDSIQVGGRISPQIVWDYLEKIRATGTKEVCLVRFTPETEEDEISYTLLFAYFSSRKRFGVVANNKKKVKDMYIIPLGATEKVPHQLVPFDGPGLENNRCNLLLGLIIRQSQGPKKDFLPVDMNETARIVIPEIKKPQQSVPLSTQELRAVKQEEKRYLTSLAPPAPAKEDKLLNTAEDADEPVRESFEEASAAEEGNNQESNKPLRFLPGVLVGWGGELPPLPDFGAKPKPAVDHSQRTQQPAPKADAVTPGTSAKSPTAASRLDRFVIKKREPRPVQAEPGLSSPTGAPRANISAVKEAVAVNQGASVSLKDKPPDVSTEAFLASLSTAAQGGNEAASVVTAKTGEVSLPPETQKSNPDGNSLSLSKPQATSDQTNSLKPPISGILKKCSAYSNVTEEKRTEVVVPEATANNPAPFVPQPVPVLTSVRHDPAVVSRQEAPQSTLSPTHTKREGASVPQASVGPAVAPTTLVPSAQQPQAVSYAATHTETTGFQYESPMASVEPAFSDAVPVGPTFSTAPPVETTFSNVAPVEPTFSDVATVEPTFSNVATFEPTFSNTATVEPTFSNTAAVDPTRSDATVEPMFSNAATVEPTFSNAATVDPTFSNAAPFPAQQPQVPGSFVYPCGPPPNVIPPPHLQDQNHAPPWAQDGAMPPHGAPPPGPLSPYADSYPPNELPLSSARDYKRSSDEYSDPWERPRHPEDRDHHGRHRHHSESRHGKKSSRHHSRERGKKHERGGHEDKYRDGSRQSGGHTDDRHGERRKERHHSDEYRSKEKDRHRHRRDSDYENGRRNSKDL